MQRNIIIAAVVVVLAIGSYWYWQEQQVVVPTYQPVATEPPGKGVVGNALRDKDPFDTTITYSDNGFEPSEVSIKQGTRVRFLNTSQAAFWPASGVHPTHSLYPEKESTDCLGSSFDACEPLPKGEFYDFTFNYVGTWPYHDHLQAFNTGMITVTE